MFKIDTARETAFVCRMSYIPCMYVCIYVYIYIHISEDVRN